MEFRSFAEMFLYCSDRRACGGDRFFELLRSYTQLFSPIMHLPFFMDIDLAGVLRTAFARVIGHGLDSSRRSKRTTRSCLLFGALRAKCCHRTTIVLHHSPLPTLPLQH